MKRILILLLVFIPVWILQTAFVVDDSIAFPEKKIQRTLKKVFKMEGVEIEQSNALNQSPTGNFYLLKYNDILQGYLYVGRVNSCRSSGCSVNPEDYHSSFEFFDYFIITDSMRSIKKVKIFNYQATQGHEVMSFGWLKQFVGYKGEQNLRYGKEIETISGATISAKALNTDIQFTIKLLQENYNQKIVTWQ